MTKFMKAAVVHEFRKPLTIDEVRIPEPGRGGIQVAIRRLGRLPHGPARCRG